MLQNGALSGNGFMRLKVKMSYYPCFPFSNRATSFFINLKRLVESIQNVEKERYRYKLLKQTWQNKHDNEIDSFLEMIMSYKGK